MNMTIWWAALLGYVLGAIPFGLLLTRIGGAGDLRSIGSGNIGATNVLRTGRKGLAAATLLLDLLKGLAAVLIARALFPGNPELAAQAAAAGAFIGHLYSIWLRFDGGKGIAGLADFGNGGANGIRAQNRGRGLSQCAGFDLQPDIGNYIAIQAHIDLDR